MVGDRKDSSTDAERAQCCAKILACAPTIDEHCGGISTIGADDAEPGVERMQRILVLGCAGAGKSTVARALGARYGLPVVHLDRHYWRPGWVAPSETDWRAEVERLAASPHWVMDGNYSGTMPQRATHANAIVFLDIPGAQPPELRPGASGCGRWLPRALRLDLHHMGLELPAALAAQDVGFASGFSGARRHSARHCGG